MKRIHQTFHRILAFAALSSLTSLSLHAEILVKNGESVAFLGDSITAAGWGDLGGYVKLVVDGLAKQGIKITPVPAGISGHKSNEMLARLERDVLSKNPTWMTLSCGVNDVWHGRNGIDLESYKKNITTIVDRATAQGVKVIILTATPIFEDLHNQENTSLAAYNDFLRALAKERKLPLADLEALFHSKLSKVPSKKESRFLTVDGVHMNPDGNVLMAEGVLGAFNLTPEQIADTEKAWLNQSDTAIFSTGNFDPRAKFGLPLAQYRALQQLASQRGVDYPRYTLELWFRAFNDTLNRHAGDAVLDPDLIKRETQAQLIEKINTLIR